MSNAPVGDASDSESTPLKDTTSPRHKDEEKVIGQAVVKHRDAAGRLTRIRDLVEASGFYLSSENAKLEKLELQDSRFLTSHYPSAVKVLYWTYKYESQPYEGGKKLCLQPERWPFACIALLILLCIPSNLEVKIRNRGFYDRVLYRDWGYATVAKNAMENDNGSEASHDEGSKSGRQEARTLQGPRGADPAYEMHEVPSRSETKSSVAAKRLTSHQHALQDRSLGPRRLFFVDWESKTAQGSPTVTAMNVSDWRARHPDLGFPEFCFVSYTTDQFPTATRDGMKSWTISDQDRLARVEAGERNRNYLEHCGVLAAKEKGIDAFWLDYECLKASEMQSEDSPEPEVWKICDIVRAAHSMIVVRGPGYGTKAQNEIGIGAQEKDALLDQWADRVWCLPELLLCPTEHRIDVYTRGEHMPKSMSKRNIAQVLSKGDQIRELIDHYEGTIHLTPLELVSIATECLFHNKYRGNYPGEVSYALMGLLRRRPVVDIEDSEFKAFARLSLANDSDRLLERLACMQPLSAESKWYDIEDAYGARLWDIEPTCQIAGIVDTPEAWMSRYHAKSYKNIKMVSIDGAHGAAITWDKLRPAAFTKRGTELRVVAVILIRLLPVFLLLGLLSLVFGLSLGRSLTGIETTFSTMGGVTLGLCALLTIFLPKILLSLYGGKLWDCQAMLYGMKGIPANLGEVERCVLGLDCGRLQWSTHGSMLSRAERKDGELRGLRPTRKGTTNVYTLIDTFTLTATVFEAERPPVVAIICGQEGGMQRALMCSYDPVSRAFCKEVVLRMKTLCLERMSRVDRFRFALRKPDLQSARS